MSDRNAPSALTNLRPELARRIGALSERVQIAHVVSEIARDEGTDILLGVIAAALEDHGRDRNPVASRLLVGVMDLLESAEGEQIGRELVFEARSRDLDEVARFLEFPAPLLVEQARKADVIRARDGRPLSLGERKSLARNPGRFELDRLLADPSADVVRNLLASPRITELDVVRIASRRPVQPEVLAEVARSSRWMMRYRVRVALLSNPHLDPALALRLAPHLLEQDRRTLATDAKLHPKLREFCDRSLRTLADDPADELPEGDSCDDITLN